MPSINSLAANLQSDHPQFRFQPSHQFRWSPSEKIVYYDSESDDYASLLHETAHATLNHNTYDKDITLLEMERDAWEYARITLSPLYSSVISEEIIEDSLDSYREWLHARSTCPACNATGVQSKKSHYKCFACGHDWRVNDARVCALRRYSL